MPELPDVEGFRRRVAAEALHQRIRHVDLAAPEMVKGVTPAQFRHRLEGHVITGAVRYGKHLLLALQQGPWLDLHFGMSGFPQYVPPNEPVPRYTRMTLDLERGRLAYVVPRRLGRLGLVTDPQALVAEHGLGADALDPQLDFPRFAQLAHGRGAVKCWLMDQSQLAGIGNVYSDEILYHARLDPRRRAGELSPAELRHLYTTLHRILTTALAHDGDPKRLPKGWLLTRRRAGQPCPACHGTIQRINLCGRSAYFCPACQK